MKHGTGLLISLLCAVTGVFAAPVVFDVAIGNATSKLVVLILGIGFLVAVILLLIHCWSENNNAKPVHSSKRF